MISVSVKLVGHLIRYTGSNSGVWTGSLPDGSTVEDLLCALKIKPQQPVLVIEKGAVLAHSTRIDSGTLFTLISHVGGG